MADTSMTGTTKKSQVIVLKTFFGFKNKPDGSMQTLADFKREVDALTPVEKDTLATQAAKALGLTQDECNFQFV